MTPKHERIATLLAQGYQPKQICQLVGCTPALISQLGKQDAFKDLLQRAYDKVMEQEQEQDLEEEERIQNKYIAAENILLDSITDSVGMMDPAERISALRVISDRQEKRALRLEKRIRPVEPSQVINNNTVHLHLPQQVVPEYQVNAQNEILRIADRNLAPMSAAGVSNLFKQMRAQREPQHPELALDLETIEQQGGNDEQGRSSESGRRSIAEIISQRATA